MNSAQPNLPPFILLLGVIVVLSFTVFVFCVVSLRAYVDIDLLKNKEEANRLLRGGFPDYSSLTSEGKLRYKVAKISLLCWVFCAAAIIVYTQINS